jgi:hypothetical protein
LPPAVHALSTDVPRRSAEVTLIVRVQTIDFD